MATKKIIDLQPKIWERLKKISQGKKVGSAYLFYGPSGCGKEGLAVAFSAGLNCRRESSFLCGQCHSCKQCQALQHEHIIFIVPLPGSESFSINQKKRTSIEGKNLELIQQAIIKKSNNPFYKIAIPKAKQILVSSVRNLKKSLYLKSQTYGRKMVLIFDSHLLSVGQGAAGNALLKILEEPPKNTTIILVSDYKEQLSETLLSRCQQICFPPLGEEVMASYLKELGMVPELIPIITKFSQGDMHKTFPFLEKTKAEVVAIIREIVLQVFTKDVSGWRQFVGTYSRLATSNPAEFRFRLYLLQLWIWSIHRERFKVSKNDNLFQNDKMLNSLVQKLLRLDVQIINTYLENILRDLNRNLNTYLALTNLLIKIDRLLQEDKNYV